MGQNIKEQEKIIRVTCQETDSRDITEPKPVGRGFKLEEKKFVYNRWLKHSVLVLFHKCKHTNNHNPTQLDPILYP